MRAISLVNKIEFQFAGNVARNALTLADLDNDGCNEFIIGNSEGTLAIFKGKEKVQVINELGFIACLAVGDIFNKNKNSLVVVTADGWCFIFETRPVPVSTCTTDDDIKEDENNEEQVDGQVLSGTENLETSGDSTTNNSKKGTSKEENTNQLIRVHDQRLPANAKDLVLGDINGDGQIEMILGLTDRVVRSYRWVFDKDGGDYLGKLVALNKWECANQIGSITIHHHVVDNKPSLLIAQPGGTFMRIRCPTNNKDPDGDSETLIDYQFLGISRMRNQNISTEILGDFRTKQGDDDDDDDKGRPYAVATLDGTIMLVQNEVILWAIAVDHQVFALTKMDMTGNGADDIVVCSWDGQTYILDQEKNSVRFHLDEPVQAFQSGFYNLNANEPAVTCLVYVTFKNTIIIYHDIPLKELIIRKFEPDNENLKLLFNKNGNCPDIDIDEKSKAELVQFLLYTK